ncbi:hypothetical protein D6817_00720 [Candidatus Pacearchaeota archaeon]|nr:MAG: hypothetical protein D6817_00720 [Candidatus Pacearchaeota archaeon]
MDEINRTEIAHLIVAVIVLFVVFGTQFVYSGNYSALSRAMLFSFFLVLVFAFVRKLVAYFYDASVEHRIWHLERFGFQPKQRFTSPMPLGLIVPFIFTLISLGKAFVVPLLTYETRPLKYRASRRFGYYSFTKMTEWHNALIGASGIVTCFLVAALAYMLNDTLLFKMSVYYAFWNLIPISKLDGTQIFFGNRILWSALAIIALFLAMVASLV